MAQLNAPWGVAADSNGNLYISDSGNHTVRKIAAGGIITTIAGTGVRGSAGDGGPAARAQLNVPLGIAVDGSGNIFVAECLNPRIRRISASGVITAVAGNGVPGDGGDGGPAVDAQLSCPHGVAVDSSGALYIADTDNHRLRKVAPDGTISTIAGNGVHGFAGDGGPAAMHSSTHQPAWRWMPRATCILPIPATTAFAGFAGRHDLDSCRLRRSAPRFQR